MNTAELRQSLAQIKSEILSALPPEGAKAGADAAALVEDRIVTTGRDSKGQALSPYSTKKVPAFFYMGRSRNNRGEAAIKAKAKQKEGVSYRDFRELNGLNTTPKNLQFTGEMWQGFGVVSVRQVTAGVVEVEIGGKVERTDRLLGYHSTREKTQISAPSEEEIKMVLQGINERFNAIVKRNL